jgi:hypothetical protein
MSRTHRNLAPQLVDARRCQAAADSILADFYREEFLKHQECLQLQRESYSECTIVEMEAALRRVIAHVDELCVQGEADVDLVVSRLLRTFDGVTRLSAWSEPTNTH